MFNKNKFAHILKNINETYNSQRDFAKKSGINRTYLSQYMNMKLNEPPMPKILKKLAESSNGITTYEELMEICGYTNNMFKNKILMLEKYKKEIESLKLTNSEMEDFKNIVLYCESPNEFRSFFKKLPSSKSILASNLYTDIMNDVTNLSIIDLAKESISMYSNLYMCPVYGRIAAGQPNWAEECIEGRIPIDPELMGIVNPEEHFFLRVNGESMNNVIKNGAFALIHKQDTVKNGEIAVVLVNGDTATLKRFTKKDDIVVLEPDSSDSEFKTQIYDKTTPIRILGKYVGKMEINN